MTPLRCAVMDLFIGGGCGLSPGEVYIEVGRGHDLSSVYRNLEILVRAGFLARSGGTDGVHRYRCTDLYALPHSHFSCSACGCLIHFDEEVPRALVEKAEKSMGFHVEGSELSLRGLCSRCLAGREGD
jgi:Fe2+ or Zn2+ uptake regulation protein